MRNVEYRFSRDFFFEQIKTAEQRLKDPSITLNERKHLIDMLIRFQDYVDSDFFDTKQQKTEITNQKEQICLNLENKFNKDLKEIPIEFWYMIKHIYNNLDTSTFQNEYKETLSISDEKND